MVHAGRVATLRPQILLLGTPWSPSTEFAPARLVKEVEAAVADAHSAATGVLAQLRARAKVVASAPFWSCRRSDMMFPTSMVRASMPMMTPEESSTATIAVTAPLSRCREDACRVSHRIA